MSALSPAPLQTPKPVATPPAPIPTQPGKPWKWLILLAIVIIAAYAAYRWQAKPQQPATPVVATRTAKIVIGTVEKTMRVAGQTSARNFANVSAPILRGPEGRGEMVLQFVAPSGSIVKKGQLIAEIDAQTAKDHIDDVKDTIESADSDIRKRKAEQAIEWETLQQTLRVVKSDFDKAKLDFGAAETRTDIERQLLKLSLDETEARYKQQQADLQFKRQSHAADLKILELTRERHVRHLQRHETDLKRFTMHATMDGMIVMSNVFRSGEMAQIQQGDRVFPGQGFMKIVDAKSMQLDASINQAESSDFRLSQNARIRFDAFPGLEMKGVVHSIGALAVGGWRQNYYIRTIPVRLAIKDFDPRIIPDLSASADVILDRVENKPIVPLGAVKEENGKYFAWVKTGETFEKREVTLGLQNTINAVVTGGLREGEEVRLN